MKNMEEQTPVSCHLALHCIVLYCIVIILTVFFCLYYLVKSYLILFGNILDRTVSYDISVHSPDFNIDLKHYSAIDLTVICVYFFRL